MPVAQEPLMLGLKVHTVYTFKVAGNIGYDSVTVLQKHDEFL